MRFVCWLFLLIAVPGFAQFKYTAVNIPGAAETEVRGVNNHGEIVGFYRLSTGSCAPIPANPQVPVCNVRGFKIVNGVLTKLMVPGSLATAIMGVNDHGDLVGFYTKTSSVCIIEQHGFIWFHHNVIVTIDYPAGTGFCGTDAAWTVPMGINKAGTVVGAVWSPGSGQPAGGFVYKYGQFNVMDLGGTGLGLCYTCTGVYGIANNGVIVGTGWRILGSIPMWVSYMKKGSDEDFFSNAQDDSWATAVNNNIDVAGYGIYGNGFFAKHIELNEGVNDAEVTPQFLPVFYPNAVGTYPFAMNNERSIVGAYMTTDGLMHGFVAAPIF